MVWGRLWRFIAPVGALYFFLCFAAQALDIEQDAVSSVRLIDTEPGQRFKASTQTGLDFVVSRRWTLVDLVTRDFCLARLSGMSFELLVGDPNNGDYQIAVDEKGKSQGYQNTLGTSG